jgi:hypothetical protein
VSVVLSKAKAGAGSAFSELPKSGVGRTTALLFGVAVGSIAIMAAVVEPSGVPWRGHLALFTVACVVLAALTGIIAVLVKRERSWAVVVPVVACCGLLVNEVLQRI